MTSVHQAVERLLAPLDWARGRVLRGLGPVARPLVTRRELRVALAGSLAVTLSFAATCLAPLWLLALGPLILGVPHLLADVRYLVVRPGHHRRPLLRVAVGLPLLVAALGGGVLAGLCAAAGAVVCSRTSDGRRATWLAVVVTLGLVAWRSGWTSDLVFSHLHNVIALVLWSLLGTRTTRLHFVPMILFVAASAAIAAGIADEALFVPGPGALDAASHVAALAPDAPGPWGLRLVALFAFAQSVHYAVWLRLVPEDDRPRATPRTFAASYRALRADFGGPALAIVALVGAAIALWSVVDLVAARDGYFRLALFHGHLELAALALVATEGRGAIGGAPNGARGVTRPC